MVGYNPEDERLKHNHGGGWKMIFLSKWVICRFQCLIFQGVLIDLLLVVSTDFC